MIVVDASVLTSMLAFPDHRGRQARECLAADIEWAAPEHWRIEVLSALRGLHLAGKLPAAWAERALGRLSRLGVDDVPISELIDRIWQMRENISAYDAAYVALAEDRGLRLLTSDRRLAQAALPHCVVELVG